MLRKAVTLAALAMFAVACSTSGEQGAPAPSSVVPTITATTTTTVNAATTDACRSLASNTDVQAVRSGIETSVQASGLKIYGAFDAIRRLNNVASTYQGIDSHVARVMADAAVIAASMHRRYAADGKFDPVGFTAMFAPVVTACRNAGVSMNAAT